MNTSTKDIESQWILISLPHSKPIVVGNIYRPPQGNIDTFIQVLDNVFNEIDLSNTELYLMGDMNIDMLDKQCESHRKFSTLIKSNGLCQLIKTPTRYSTTKNSLIDICATNSNFIQKSGVCDINLSDHQMILITRKKMKLHKQKCSFTGRSYRNYNKGEFQNSVRNANWEAFKNETTIEGKWYEFTKILYNIIDVTCPLKTFKIKQQKEPWITAPLIELIKDKDLALKQAKKTKA